MRNDFCSNYLEHSAKGSTWKKKGAKYISRVWKNGKWVYEYKITGKGYKKDRQNHISKAIKSSSNAEMALQIASKTKTANAASEAKKFAASEAKDASYHGRKAAEAESSYLTKSLAGKIERGQKKIDNLFSSKTNETIKDTFTGKTRTPDRSGETINIKEAAKQNSSNVKETIKDTFTGKTRSVDRSGETINIKEASKKNKKKKK